MLPEGRGSFIALSAWLCCFLIRSCVTGGLTGERRAFGDAEPSDRALEVSGGELRSPVVPKFYAAPDVVVDPTEAVG
jgi:hypothetical protein